MDLVRAEVCTKVNRDVKKGLRVRSCDNACMQCCARDAVRNRVRMRDIFVIDS